MRYNNDEFKVVMAVLITVGILAAGAIGFLMGYYYNLNTNCF